MMTKGVCLCILHGYYGMLIIAKIGKNVIKTKFYFNIIVKFGFARCTKKFFLHSLAQTFARLYISWDKIGCGSE